MRWRRVLAALALAALATLVVLALWPERQDLGRDAVPPPAQPSSAELDRSPTPPPEPERPETIEFSAKLSDSEARELVAREPIPAEDWPTQGTAVLAVREGERPWLLRSPGGQRIGWIGERNEFGTPSVFSVVRREGPWIGLTTPYLPNGKLTWTWADREMWRVSSVGQEVRVDLSEARAEVWRGGRLEMSFPVGTGAAATPTPTGRFAITDIFTGARLNPAYGCCALAISATQPNLPENWIGGNRIAIHGGAVDAASSTGCLRADETVLRELVTRLPLGTPVVIQQ